MRFHFADCVLDADRREFHRAGEVVAMEPQVFDLLLHLVRHQDRVVSRDELIEAVWGGRIVADSTISSRINTARRATGDVGAEQALIRTLARRGFRFVGSARADALDTAVTDAATDPHQNVALCRTKDGVGLAVASVGSGPRPLIKAANWNTHVEYDWQSPFWAPLLRHLANGRRLVRYDPRGTGLSDRDPPEISFATFLLDLDAVVAAACPEGRFALLGISQGAATAAAYAALHPERVSHLVVYGGFAQGRRRRGQQAEIDVADAFVALMRSGWGDERSAFMQAYGSTFFPTASATQLRGWAEIQRRSASVEAAIRIRNASDDIEVTALLPRVVAPTLVLHCRGDSVVPFEQGRLIASAIPGARLVALDSDNHVVLPEEPEWPRMLAEIDRFLGG